MRNNYPKSASLLQKPARKRSGQWRLLMAAAMAVGLTTVTAFGQHTQTHKVSFSNIDGFSGEVSFTSSREGFATQLRGKNATLSITDYKCSDEDKAALQKAGLNLWSGFQPKTFGVVVQGKAYVQEGYYNSYSVSNDKLHLNQGLGDFTTPTFDEEVQARAKEYQHKYNESYWERYGGFDAKEVTELYLSDLKNEINRITYAAKKEKQEAEQKEKEAKEKAEKEKQDATAKNDNVSGSNGTGDKADDAEQSSSSESDQTSGSSSERRSAANQPRQQSNHAENIRKYNAINRDIANVDKVHNEFNNAIDQVSAGMAEKTRADQQASKDWWENEKAEAAKIREEKRQRELEWEQNRRKEEEDLNRRNDIMREKIAQSKPGAYDYMHNFSEDGLAMVTIEVWGVGVKCGFIDKTGKEIVPLKYDGAEDFSEGLAMVSVGDAVMLKTKKGFIGKTGREIVPIKYDDAGSFSEGLAYVKTNNKYGFIDKNGNTVIPFDYDYAYSFSEGLAWVENNKYKYGFIDKSGNEVIPFKYEFILKNSFSEGLACVKLNDKYGFIDKTGREVIPLKYDYAEDFSDGLAKVELNGKYGFINKAGEEAIPLTLEYTFVYSFSEGWARVKLNGKYGFIDKTGNEIVAPKYDRAEDFSDGLANVELNGKYGFIDTTGKEVIPLEYDDANSFKNGKTIVKLNGSFYSIDKTGKKAKAVNH